jgi:hypothetical protein
VRRPVLIAVAVVVFLLVAFGLARWLTTENGERNEVTQLLEDQLRGDADAMLARLEGCAERPACAAAVRDNARRLSGPGKLEIVRYDSGTSYSLGSASGPTRVVWKTPDRLTTVQCVGVEREGNVLSGLSVSLTSLSRPIGREAPCP